MDERPRPLESALESPLWAVPDERYWQAALEQGEFAPNSMPPAEPRGSFVADTGYFEGESPPTAEHGTTETRMYPVEQDYPPEGWGVAVLALKEVDAFELRVTGVNRDWTGEVFCTRGRSYRRGKGFSYAC